MERAAPSEQDRRRRAAEVVRRLNESYGTPQWQPSGAPVDELVQTILSQHTSDVNSRRAYAELRRRFPTWEAVVAAPVEEVAAAIRAGGLARQKAPRIQAALAAILASGEDPPLASLATLPLPEAKARLTALPGVGPKTAACVLLFACGRPALPVDTHVYRVSRRIGLIDPNVSEADAHDRLEALVDPEDVYTFHVNVIRHGRQVCVATRPRCDRCCLTDLCDYAQHQERPVHDRAGASS
ncbi:MAG: endonuclease III [Sphaerobacter sp.]|nr:endonuclease III [Sphaerobacter sp.]